MRILFYLPNISNYQDRAKTFALVAKYIERVILVAGVKDAEISGELPNNFTLTGVNDNKKSSGFSAKLFFIYRLIKNEKIDALHDTFASLWPLYFLKKLMNVTIFSSFYCLNAWRLRNVWPDVKFYHSLTDANARMMWYGKFTEFIASILADVVVLQAPGLIERFKEDYSVSDNKIGYLENSVDVDFWKREKSIEVSETGEPVNLVFFGASSMSRGLNCLLDTVVGLKEKNIKCFLNLVGPVNNDEKDILFRQLTEKNIERNIILHGMCDKTKAKKTLETSDIFVYQSINDGSPRTVIEAMSLGVPIIASKHPGIDILDVDRKYVKFTEFSETQKIVSFIEDYITNKAAWIETANACAKHIRESFSCEEAAKKYAAFYNRVK